MSARQSRITPETERALLAFRDAVETLTQQGLSLPELCVLVNEIRTLWRRTNETQTRA